MGFFKKSALYGVKGIVIIMALIYMIPVVLLVTNSFMEPWEINMRYSNEYPKYMEMEDIHYASYSLIPKKAGVGQYTDILFGSPEYLNKFLNSIILTVPSLILQIVIGLVTAYGIVVWKGKYKKALLSLYALVMMLPFQAVLVPNYFMVSKLGLIDSYFSVILTAAFGPLPVIIMFQSVCSVPKNIFEAAQIDGAGHLRQILHIVIPLSVGGIASLFTVSFADLWGMVEQPLIFIRSSAKEPLSIYINNSTNTGGAFFAAAVLYMLPGLWVFLYGNEYYVKGIRTASFK